MDSSARAIRREQRRQAKVIHGGLWNLLVALTAVKLARLPIPSKRVRTASLRAQPSTRAQPTRQNRDVSCSNQRPNIFRNRVMGPPAATTSEVQAT